jgi:hypothetical protein
MYHFDQFGSPVTRDMPAEILVSADARNGHDIPFFRLNFQENSNFANVIFRFAQMISALGQSCRDLRDISETPVTRDLQ